MSVTMWEVRAADGRAAELLDWVLGRTRRQPGVPERAGCRARRPVRRTRLVVIDPTGTARQRLADPPAELIARPAHAWDFEPVRNG